MSSRFLITNNSCSPRHLTRILSRLEQRHPQSLYRANQPTNHQLIYEIVRKPFPINQLRLHSIAFTQPKHTSALEDGTIITHTLPNGGSIDDALLQTGQKCKTPSEARNPALTPHISTQKSNDKGHESIKNIRAPEVAKQIEISLDFTPVGRHPSSGFLVAWRTLYHKLRSPEHGDLALARKNFNDEQKLASDFFQATNVKNIRQEWLRKSFDDRLASLPSILIGALLTSVQKTIMVLSHLNRLVPSQFVVYADCLIYLRLMYKDELRKDKSALRSFKQQVSRLRNPIYWPRYSLSEVYLDLLLEGCSTPEKFEIVEKYLDTYKHISRSSVLYVVDFFTRERDVARAIETLSLLPEKELRKSEPDVLHRCIRLLYLDYVQQEGTAQGFAILPQLLRLGIRPNDLLHNMVLRNAILLGLPNVAWDLYRYMKAGKIQVAARSHLLLLKDSFERQDSHGLDEIMSAIHQNEEVARNPYIVVYTMNIVRILCFFERHTSSEESFSHILAIYDRAYDRAPLLKLGIASPKDKRTSISLAEPDPVVLGYTIWSYILVQHQESSVSRLWQWLIHSIEDKESDIIQAAKNDMLYNGFILFYSRWPSTLAKGLQVLQYMLDSNLCQPTARTWSLMICAFLKHGFDESADRIRQMMISNKVRIDDESLRFVLEKYPQTNMAEKVEMILDGRKIPEELTVDLKMSNPLSDKIDAWKESDFAYPPR